MKYSKPRKIYYCQQCNIPTQTLHEVCFGNSNRKIAIEYSIQVPVCNDCHKKAHGTDKRPEKGYKEKWQKTFLDWLGMDMYVTIRAFNNYRLRGYLEINKEACEEKIRSLEID